MTSLNATEIVLQYGGRQRIIKKKKCYFKKSTFRNEMRASKRIYHGCEGR